MGQNEMGDFKMGKNDKYIVLACKCVEGENTPRVRTHYRRKIEKASALADKLRKAGWFAFVRENNGGKVTTFCG